jgi:uncharacterized protein (TIGR02246 family)
MADGIDALYRRLLNAWNDRDGGAMAATFALHGEMIGFDGSQIQGRSQIASELNRIVSDHETAAFVAKVKGVRRLAEGIAFLRAIAGMIPPGQSDLNPDVNTHHTVLAERIEGEWLISLFQNTPAQFHERPELRERFTEELRQLL